MQNYCPIGKLTNYCLSLNWLAGNTVMYMHDDSENMDDSFTIQLTDGRHQLNKQVMVKVQSVNDEKPHVIR